MRNPLVDSYELIIKLIDNSDSIAVISHCNPDGDTLGCALAMYQALLNYNKKVHIFCENTPGRKYKTLFKVDDFNKYDYLENRYDLAIAVDTADIDRLGRYKFLFKNTKYQVQIDHHTINNKYAKNVNIVEKAAANAENVYLFLEYFDKIKNNKIITDNVAAMLYVGLLTDSGCFAFSSTTPQTFDIASKLIKYNFNYRDYPDIYVNSMDYPTYLLKQRCINKAKFYDNNRIAISVFSQIDFMETGTDMSCTDGIIRNLINVDTVKVAVCLTEINEYLYKCSIRSKGNISAAEIAAVFNGGGHFNASGCQIAGHIEDTKDKLLKAIRDRLE